MRRIGRGFFAQESLRACEQVAFNQLVNNAERQSVSGFDLQLQCQGALRTLRTPLARVQVLSWHDQQAVLLMDGVQRRITAVADGATLHLVLDGAVFTFEEPSPYPQQNKAADPRYARAPVAGVVAQVAVQAGDLVATGQPLLCVEAMKMEMWLHAAAAGRVLAVNAKPREAVAAGALLVELEISASPTPSSHL